MMLRIGIFVLYISKVTKRTLILSSKKQTNHKLIIIKGKKTRILSKEPTNHRLSKEPSEPTKRNKANQVRYYQIIKGTERTLAKNYILAKEPTNKLENQAK